MPRIIPFSKISIKIDKFRIEYGYNLREIAEGSGISYSSLQEIRRNDYTRPEVKTKVLEFIDLVRNTQQPSIQQKTYST